MEYVLAQGKSKMYGVYNTKQHRLIFESDIFDEALQYAVDMI